MTDRTQPEALRLANVCSNLTRYSMDAHLIAAELLRQHAENETLRAGYAAARLEIESLQSQLALRFTAADMATASAQGFRDGVASVAANAREPVYQARYQKGFWQDSSRERYEYLQNPENTCAEDWETRALYAAPPTAQAEGWQSIETAPKEGVFLVFMQDEVRPARRMQAANWHPNVKIVGGLFAFDCAKVTHWMPLPLPPTSAEGVEHG